MSKGIFEQVEQYVEDFKILKLSLSSSLRAAEDVVAAVKARIERDKAADSEREAELHQTSVDPSRPAAVRKLAAVELEGMKGRTYAPTEPERLAFEGEVQEARQALRDLNELRGKLEGAFAEARRTLDEMSGSSIVGPGAFIPAISERQVSGAVEDFDRLSRLG